MSWAWLILLGVALESPSYEKEIAEKNKVSLETKKEDQKSFYETINNKTQEVLNFIRKNKEELRKKQEAVRKDFEGKLKTEVDTLKKQDPRGDIEAVRKAANEQRRDLFEKMNTEKKSLEDQLKSFKDGFDDFIKAQKEIFQKTFKDLTLKAKTPKAKAEPLPSQKEFDEIPKGPSTVLAPDK